MSGGSPPASNPGNSGNAGTPVVTQAADATSVTGSAVRSGAVLATTSAGCVVTIQPRLMIFNQFHRRATSTLPLSLTVSRSASTASSTPSRVASGAESRFKLGGFGSGVLGLVGAMFLYF